MNATPRAIDSFSAFLVLIHLTLDAHGEIVSSREETVYVEVPCTPAERRDSVTARRRLVHFGRAELARRGVAHGAVMFNGGERFPIAADATEDLRLAGWR